jgi:aryl-alcohol dehydrogenase-like predicted oxidoreductase
MELRVKQSSYKGAALAGTIDLGDLTVNRLGFGAMRLCGDSAWGRPRDREHVNRVLHRAVELGVNFIDTADSYGPETNELLISQELYPYPPGLVIATKGGLVRPDRRSWSRTVAPTIYGARLKAVYSACGWTASICTNSMRLTPMCRF